MSARLKANRGKENLASLQAEVSRWLAESEAPRFTVEVADGGHTHIVRVVDVPAVPVSWPLELGDALHNLRSALDHLAWQAVLANGGTPGKGTSFPVLRERKERSVTAALSGASPDLVEEVRQVQPYNRCKTADSLRGDPLWTLHRLDIEDKHRLLVLSPILVNTLRYNVPAEAVGCRVRATLQPAVDGAEVMRLYDLPQPIESLPIDPHGEYDVWVGETEDTAYLAVSALEALVRPVEQLIATFERHS